MGSRPRTAVIGAGVTGLAAGASSGAPVFERGDGPGGICRSYYIEPGTDRPLAQAPPGGGAYRFEVGGGHWLFGGDPVTIARLAAIAELRTYERRAAVRLGSLARTVPYPVQANVDLLGESVAAAVAAEAGTGQSPDPAAEPTLGAWLRATFGPTLDDLFFRPFHDRYTAGLTDQIAPQDDYKTPRTGGHGYNATFRYPVGGLDALTRALAGSADVRYAKRVVGIDGATRTVVFDDGTDDGYDRIVSTLPLHEAVAAAGIETDAPPDPYTSVLVVNIGAERGPACPDAHWQYEPDAAAGFHRIGFYSNVDPDFLPADRRAHRDPGHVSMYVERSYRGGEPPGETEVKQYCTAVVDELTERGYVGPVEVVHPSWVEVAYTWRRPGSQWRTEALGALGALGVDQVGRYARWHFQGIAASIAEGDAAGRALAG